MIKQKLILALAIFITMSGISKMSSAKADEASSYEYVWDSYNKPSRREYTTLNIFENGVLISAVKAKGKKTGGWLMPHLNRRSYKATKISANHVKLELEKQRGYKGLWQLSVNKDELVIKKILGSRSKISRWGRVNRRQYNAFKAMLHFVEDQSPTLKLFKAIETADLAGAKTALESGAWIRGYSTYYNLVPANFAININAGEEILLLLYQYEPNGFDTIFFGKLASEMKLKIIAMGQMDPELAGAEWSTNLKAFCQNNTEKELLTKMNGWVPEIKNKRLLSIALGELEKRKYYNVARLVVNNSKVSKKDFDVQKKYKNLMGKIK